MSPPASRRSWAATVLTLHPEMFPGPLGASLSGDALARGVWSLEARNIREHGIGRHRAVDDTPAGGGPGMVMKADVLARAIDAVPADGRPRLLMSPRGAPLTQSRVADLAKGEGAVILCGRFEARASICSERMANVTWTSLRELPSTCWGMGIRT